MPSEVLFAALTGAISALFWALLRAKDTHIQDVTEDRNLWRQMAISGTELAKDALEAPSTPRRTR